MYKLEPEELESRLELSEQKRVQLQKKLTQKTVDEEIPLWSMVDLMTLLLIFFFFFYTTAIKGSLSASQDLPKDSSSLQIESSAFYQEKTEEKALIAGDTLTSGMPPFMGHGNITQWISTLTWMKDLDVDTIVPGHGEICSKDEINRLLEFLTSLRNLISDHIKKGSDIEGITAEAENMTNGIYTIDPEMFEETKMLLAASIPNLYNQIQG